MDEELIRKIENLYNISTLRFVEKVSGGYLSNNFIVKTEEAKYFLKQYRFTVVNKIEEVQAVKKYFYSCHIPAIMPLETTEGKTYFEFNDGYFALFPFVEGVVYKYGTITPSALESTGKMLAKIHLAGKNPPFTVTEQNKTWDKDRFVQRAKAILEIIKNKAKKDDFDKTAEETLKLKLTLAEGNQVKFSDLNILNDHLIHGDYHVNNLFFDAQDNVKYVFDWEKTEMAPRGAELVRCMYITCFDTHFEEKNFNDADIYLKAYNELYQISQNELANIIRFNFIKHIHSLWVETEHYIYNNTRVDIFLDKAGNVEYQSKNLNSFIERVTSNLPSLIDQQK